MSGVRLPPALHHRDFRRLWSSILFSGVATQMVSVAVGWQVYSIHHSAFDLGLIGLAEFLPVPLLALPTGQLADRFRRTRIVAASTLAEAGVVVLLLVVTLNGAHQLWQFLVLAAATGAAAQLGGPAVGGLLFAISPEAVYALGAALLALAALYVGLMQSSEPIEQAAGTPALRNLLGGIAFIRRTPELLGAISLDLFAVLFGGAVALLPLFAKSILHTGPFGLGILRSSIAVGALVAGIRLARKPLGRHAGRTLLLVVAAYGASIVVFGLSRWFVVSALALAAGGFVDMISMNIRSMIVALATPNRLRGRVNAVEGVFIGASNELGAFESGVAASLLGAVPAVVAGGVVTVLLAVIWPRFFPALTKIDRLEDVAPAPEPLIANAG